MNEMVRQDYVDITPRDAGGKGAAGNTQVVFQEDEKSNIENNPSNLTKEGIQKKIDLWSSSSNAQLKTLYAVMAKQCKTIAASGTTQDGRIIYSRDNAGLPKWLEEIKFEKVKEKKKGD